jgi:hypothetical protein
MNLIRLLFTISICLLGFTSLAIAPVRADIITTDLNLTLIPSPSELPTSETNILGTVLYYRSSPNLTNYSNFDVIWGAQSGAFVGDRPPLSDPIGMLV